VTTVARSSRLVPLARRSGRPTSVLLPGAGGGGTYLGLARYLAGSYDVSALRATGLQPGEEPEDGIPTMAASAERALEGAVPRLVVGWSLGGVVAWELGARGHRPDLVVVDSAPYPVPMPDVSGDEVWQHIVATAGPSLDADIVDRLHKTYRAHRTALTTHTIRSVYPGRVLLLMCPGNRADAIGRLRALGADLRTGRLGAGHLTVLDPEHLPHLTAAIGSFLGEKAR
jgi:hypothetical protein